MKEGFVLKSEACGAPTPEDLAQINRHTRRAFDVGEIYVFSVVLCDNEIDRDYERFTKEALEKLGELFVGKTGIFDHSMKGSDQTARIFRCWTEADDLRTTRAGEPYCRLMARAYMPRTAKNADFILELDSGIKKEVSVGCAVASASCSVCGADVRRAGCKHQKGKLYREKGKEQLCHVVLDQPTDAYEWSFVAVPAQREAGVTKAFAALSAGEEASGALLRKELSMGTPVQLSGEQALALGAYLERLEDAAADGERYREELRAEVVRLCAIAAPGLPRDVMKGLCGRMSAEELQAFRAAFSARAAELLPVRAQLAPPAKEGRAEENSQFKI